MRQLARRIDAQQLIGKIVRCTLGAILRASPLAAAESAERGVLSARVARNPAELFGWHEDAITAAVLNLQVVALVTFAAAPHHAQESPEAVIDMHQEVAWRQPLRRLSRDPAAVHRHAADTRCAEEFAIGDYGQRIHTALEAAVESTVQERDAPRFRIARDRRTHWRCSASLGEQFGESRRLLRDDHHARAVALPPLYRLAQGTRAASGNQWIVPGEGIARRALGHAPRLRTPGEFESRSSTRRECRNADRWRWDWRRP